MVTDHPKSIKKLLKGRSFRELPRKKLAYAALPKRHEGRVFPFTQGLRELLEAQEAETEKLQKEKGIVCPWVFHRDGHPIKSYDGAWRSACKKAGLPGRKVHDFRRTAVRRLEQAGVSRSVAMKLTGHKTESVYRRYAIVSRSDLEDAARRIDAAS
jgi:integrase